MGNMCITDLSAGMFVRVVLLDGRMVEGFVISNYGASVYIQKEDGGGVAVQNGGILSLEIPRKVDMDLYRKNYAKSRKEFSELMDKMRSPERPR